MSGTGIFIIKLKIILRNGYNFNEENPQKKPPIKGDLSPPTKKLKQ